MEDKNQTLSVKIKPTVKIGFILFYGILFLIFSSVLFMKYTEPHDIGAKFFSLMMLFYIISIVMGFYTLRDYHIFIDNKHLKYNYINTSCNIPLQNITKITFDIFELTASERSNTKNFDIEHYSQWFINTEYFVVFTDDGNYYKIVYSMHSRAILYFWGSVTTFSKRKFKKLLENLIEVNNFDINIKY